MDNFTGFNPQEANLCITNFAEICSEALYKMGNANANFSIELKEVWASPKAVEFEQKLWDLSTTINNARNSLEDVLTNIKRSIIITAHSNGDYNWNNDTRIPWNYNVPNPRRLSESRDGLVGMNVAQVQNLFSTFNDQIYQGYRSLENLQLNIGVYDPTGSVQNMFDTVVNKIVQSIGENMNDIMTSIQSATETEVNEIRLAKEQAVQTLAG